MLNDKIFSLRTKHKPNKCITALKRAIKLENFLANLAREIL